MRKIYKINIFINYSIHIKLKHEQNMKCKKYQIKEQHFFALH